MLKAIERTPENSAGRVMITSCGCEYGTTELATGNYVKSIAQFNGRVLIEMKCMACRGDRLITYYPPISKPGYGSVLMCMQCMSFNKKEDMRLLSEGIGQVKNLTVARMVYECSSCGAAVPELVFPTEAEVFEDE